MKSALSEKLTKNKICKKLHYCLFVKICQLGPFYLLLKTHKHLNNVLGRPVISNNGTLTGRIPVYLNYHFKSIVPTVPHILEATRDFTNRIKDLNTENCILVKFDVLGLHPHIPHEEQLKTILKIFEVQENKTVTTGSLVELAKMILKRLLQTE